MALQKDHTLDGVEHKALYIRFQHVIPEGKIGDKVKVRAVLFAYASKEHADSENAMPVCYFDAGFEYDLSLPDNLWAQGYSAAKSIPAMQGSVDC